MEKLEEVDTIIVGAGLHGLIMAKTYLQVHPDLNIIVADQARSIGGTWAKERLYPGLKTNNTIGSYEFGDFPMIPEQYGLRPGDHIPGTAVYQYFDNYAKQFNLYKHIRLETKVISAVLQDDGCWLVQVQQLGEGEALTSLRAKYLVVATGLTSEPNIPTFPGQKQFQGEIFHAKELRDRSDYLASTKEIVVVGGNKSAWDACYFTARMGIRVHMVIRRSGGGPSYIWPGSFTWGPFQLSFAKIAATRIFAPFDPSPFGSSMMSRWARDFLHGTTIGRWLCQQFWTRLDRHVKNWHGFQSHPALKKLEPWTTPYWMSNAVSTHNYETNWFDLVRSGMITVHIADVTSIAADEVFLSDGERVAAEAIVCCTGWKLDPTISIYPPEAAGTISETWDSPDVQGNFDHAMDFVRSKNSQFFTLLTRTENAPRVESGLHKPAANPFELYRFMVPWQRRFLDTKNIAFIGMETAFNTAVASQAQALWITAFFNDEIPHLRSSLLDADAVRRDAVLQRVYSTLRRPREASGVAGKFPQLVFDAFHYVDCLLTDLQLPYKRKSSWFKEFFEPYRPSDYGDLAHEWLSQNR